MKKGIMCWVMLAEVLLVVILVIILVQHFTTQKEGGIITLEWCVIIDDGMSEEDILGELKKMGEKNIEKIQCPPKDTEFIVMEVEWPPPQRVCIKTICHHHPK